MLLNKNTNDSEYFVTLITSDKKKIKCGKNILTKDSKFFKLLLEKYEINKKNFKLDFHSKSVEHFIKYISGDTEPRENTQEDIIETLYFANYIEHESFELNCLSKLNKSKCDNFWIRKKAIYLLTHLLFLHYEAFELLKIFKKKDIYYLGYFFEKKKKYYSGSDTFKYEKIPESSYWFWSNTKAIDENIFFDTKYIAEKEDFENLCKFSFYSRTPVFLIPEKKKIIQNNLKFFYFLNLKEKKVAFNFKAFLLVNLLENYTEFKNQDLLEYFFERWKDTNIFVFKIQYFSLYKIKDMTTAGLINKIIDKKFLKNFKVTSYDNESYEYEPYNEPYDEPYQEL